jgi:uncharacterized protein (TIGR03086 family)
MTTTDASQQVKVLHRRAVELFRDRAHGVTNEAWSRATPCLGWDVRTLVNHVVGEDLWTVPLMAGRTIEEVGDRYDGDVLGQSPVRSVDSATKSAIAALQQRGVTTRTVHLSFGDTPATEYVWQLITDHLIHAWDLAVATGGDTHLDDDLVAAVAGWFREREGMYREGGAVAARPSVPTWSPQDELLVAFGRDPSWTETHDVVRRFCAAWEAWDMDAALVLMADDAVFESTGPTPDGSRFEGAAAIRAVWEEMARTTRGPEFRFEEAFVSGERATARWRFSWTNEDGSTGHVRGADVMRVRDGKVVEKLSYVKG